MNRKIPASISLLLGLSLTGCAMQEKLSFGVDDPCASLQNIAADYDSGFANYRGKASNFNSVTIYRAREQIISGHCEIWAWANKESAYICSSTAPNEDVAKVMYNNSIASVAQCIGSAWTQEAETQRVRDGEPAGVVTHFSANEDKKASVSVHRVDFHRNNSVYIYIGPASRLDHF
jgi:hypothetical protein